MLQRLVLCAALACALFAMRGSAQPAQCAQTFRVEDDRDDLYIVPRVVNCFSCALDTVGDVSWQVERDGDLVLATSSPDAAVDGNFLIIAMPENYVLPGTSGRRDIACTSVVNGQNLEPRLASPILAQPRFDDATVNEGAQLKITCLTRNIADITTFQVLNPNGVAVSTTLGVYTVDNVTRDFAGVYTCIITNNMDSSTINATSTVVIQYAPEVTANNVSSHRIILGEELRLSCSYVGVPDPTVLWFQNDTIMLMDSVDGVTISGGAPGDNFISLVIGTVQRTSGGTYTCRANNTVGMDDQQYSVTILVPAEPVSNLMETTVGETSISLSWMTGGDGFTPITGIEILVLPERGANPSTNPRTLNPTNSTTIDDLLPFRDHTFSIAVVNAAGLSERRNITVSTLSLPLLVPNNLMLEALSSTSLQFSWMPPTFDNDITDDPNFYLVKFARFDLEDLIYLNVSAADPRVLTFNDLMKGTGYIVMIVAVNDAGNGTSSVFIPQETNVDPPSEPQELTVTGVGATVLSVTWTAPADNGGRPVTNYRITVNSINFNMIVLAGTTSLLIRDSGLEENTAYTVNVSAANEQGFGNAASEMGTTQSILEPQTIFDMPQSDMAESTNKSAVLNWVNPGGTVDLYTVEYVLARDSDGFDSANVLSVIVNGSETSVVVSDLLPGASYEFRVAVNNSRGMSAFSLLGSFQTLSPDAPVITPSHVNPVLEGTTIILNCTSTLEGAVYSWTKDDASLPADSMFDINPNYLRIVMINPDTAGSYICTATTDNNMVMSDPFVLTVQPTEPPDTPGIDQNVIIIVASVGGAALLIFVIVVVVAVICLCNMKKRGSKSSYAVKLKPVKSKDRSNANWIETSTQFVPATGNQAASTTDGDRLAFDYSVDLQTHSSFNTLEKQKVHSTANGSDQPPPPSYSNSATVV